MRDNRIPVSTEKTGCVPFHKGQKAENGYKIGENPVKENGYFVSDFSRALAELRVMKAAGWRDYGRGNSKGARKAIGWVTRHDADMLLAEPDDAKRVALFKRLTDVVA